MKRSAWMSAAVLGMAAGAVAQNQPSAPTIELSVRDRMIQEQTRKQEEAAAARLLTVNFPGGTIGQYVEALRKASAGGSANIVVSDRSSKVPISAINLKGVDIGVAVAAIPAAYSGARGAWHIDPVFPSGRLQGIGSVDMTSITYSVDFESVLEYRRDDLKVESFSLGRLLNPAGEAKPESDPRIVLTAIETGLHLLIAEGDPQPELKFHPDSTLLFVRGTSAEVDLVKSVISRMSEEAVRRMAITQRRTRAEQTRNLQVKEATLRIQIKEMEFEAVASELKATAQQVQAGTASATEMARIQLEYNRAKMNIEMAKIELERSQLDNADDVSAVIDPAGQPAASPGQPPMQVPNPNINGRRTR